MYFIVRSASMVGRNKNLLQSFMTKISYDFNPLLRKGELGKVVATLARGALREKRGRLQPQAHQIPLLRPMRYARRLTHSL